MATNPFRSRATARRNIAAGVFAVALFAMTACTRGPHISTQAAGHTITVRIKGNGTKVESHADGALLGSEFGQVTVERARMRIDGEAWIRIAEGAPVAVSIERGRITLKAGVVSVGRTISY